MCPLKVLYCVKVEDLFLYSISLRSRHHGINCYFISWHNTGSGAHRTKPFVIIYILLFLSRQIPQQPGVHYAN